MKLVRSWLSDFIDLSGISSQEIVKRLTLSTCELESAQENYTHLNEIQIASVLSVEKHPHADRLHVCRVKSSQGEQTIVCGAANVRPNMQAALAPVGSTLPVQSDEQAGSKPSSKSFVIRKARIRGIESFGMLCSAKELQLDNIAAKAPSLEDGILDLEELAAGDQSLPRPLSLPLPLIDKKKMRQTGLPIARLFPFCDFVFEVENKSITHRPDLWSHWGFAKELSVLFQRPLRFDPLKIKLKKAMQNLPQKEIHIEKGAALGYYGLHVRKVRVVPSPLWMQGRLMNIGQRPINNIVDTSNYVMFDVGQPTHAFAAAKLKEKSIYVVQNKKAFAIDSFTALDKEKRKIPQGAILIMDGPPQKKQTAALGGIIGGLDSSVQKDTEELFLESAAFPRSLIRKAIGTLGLRTDSAQRFEKGLDPSQAAPALSRFIQILEQNFGEVEVGKLCGEMLEAPKKEHKKNQKENIIYTSLSFLRKRLGFLISVQEIEKTLKGLGFAVRVKENKKNNKNIDNKDNKEFQITVPSYRSQYDVRLPEDIVEELGRIHGYDNIQPQPPAARLSPMPAPPKRQLLRQVRSYMAYSAHFSETYNYSFASSAHNALWNKKAVVLKNPAFEHKSELRTSLLPGLLEQAAANQDRFLEVRLFETGRIYFQNQKHKKNDSLPNGPLPNEENRVALLFMPMLTDAPLAPPVPIDALKKEKNEKTKAILPSLLWLRQKIEALFQEILGKHFQAVSPSQEMLQSKYSKEYFIHLHPGSCIAFCDSVKILGSLGILHPAWEKRFAVKRPTLAAEINFDALYDSHKDSREKTRGGLNYSPPSVYPVSRFEISLLMPAQSKTHIPVNLIQKMDIKAVESVRYLKEYQGPPLLPDQKSVSYEITCSKSESTFKSEELQEILDKIVEDLKQAGFALRT